MEAKGGDVDTAGDVRAGRGLRVGGECLEESDECGRNAPGMSERGLF